MSQSCELTAARWVKEGCECSRRRNSDLNGDRSLTNARPMTPCSGRCWQDVAQVLRMWIRS